MRISRRDSDLSRAEKALGLSPIFALAPIVGGSLRLCVGDDPESQLKQMQQWHDTGVGVVLIMWAQSKEHAARIFKMAEQMMAGQHVRGRHYRIAPPDLEVLLQRAANALGLSLLTDADRLRMVQREADRELRRLTR